MFLNWTSKWTMKFRTKLIFITTMNQILLWVRSLILIGVRDPEYSYCDFFFIRSLSRFGCGMGYGIQATWKWKLCNRILYLFLIIICYSMVYFPPATVGCDILWFPFLYCNWNYSLETSWSDVGFWLFRKIWLLQRICAMYMSRCRRKSRFCPEHILEFFWKKGLKTWLNPKYIFLDWSSVNMVSLVDVFSVQIICRNVFLNPQLIRYAVSSHQFATITNTLFLTCYFLVV